MNAQTSIQILQAYATGLAVAEDLTTFDLLIGKQNWLIKQL